MGVSEAVRGQLVQRFEALLPHLNERQRRLAVATEARLLGHGGVRWAARTAQVSETTVRKGIAELAAAEPLPEGRVRRLGGGRKRADALDPQLVPALMALVEPDERGDPMSPLRWTTKSLRHLAAELSRQGHRVTAPTVGRLLKENGFSLQGTAKILEGEQHPDRDAQFRHINEQVKDHQAAGEPVISVDAKKKEQIGLLPMSGREWRPGKQPLAVEDHSFFAGPHVDAVIPYGIYDMTANSGWVNVGTDHNTAVFAASSIRRWWHERGRHDYPQASRLLITADAGGSNSDPQGIAHAPRAMWWDILSDCHTMEGARRLAGHFVASVNDDQSKKDFWISAAQNTLTALFLAAARGRATLHDLLAWLADPADRTPVDLLRDSGLTAMAEQLQGTVRGAVETRDGIYETARQCVACLLDPEIAAWVMPDPQLPQFNPHEHALGRDTLYLLSKDGGGSAAGVIAGLADATMRAGVIAAERMGGRLDPPMTAVLDEAANVCRISDLPDLYSHLGSRGINVVTLLQSYRQGSRVWGDAGMDAMWSAATIKLLGAGLDDADFVEKVSKLVGNADVRTPSISKSKDGTSRSYSYRLDPVLPADRIRALPKGTALLLATGVRPALIRLRPWYKEPNAGAISAAAKAETAAITERATRAWSGTAGAGITGTASRWHRDAVPPKDAVSLHEDAAW